MQKGFSVILLILGLLIILSGSFGGYYAYKYYQNQKITNFESCSKVYPVLLSYPGQCNTSDGKHFVQQLSEEEKKNLIPPQEATQSAEETSGWSTYTGDTSYGSPSKFIIKYPSSWVLENNVLYPFGIKDSKTDPEIGLGVGGHDGKPGINDIGHKVFPAGEAYYIWSVPEGEQSVYALANFEKKNISYIFEGSNIPKNSPVINETIFDQMLSTFKIIDTQPTLDFPVGPPN